MQTILYTLQTNGKAFDHDRSDFFERYPYLDFDGEQGLSRMRRPGAIKTHLPIDRVPHHPRAKYICVIRNPRDVCVSFYVFYNTWAMTYPLDFNEFFEVFIQGRLPFNDYFECLRLTWERRHNTNVLLVSFEEMKNDVRIVIQKVSNRHSDTISSS